MKPLNLRTKAMNRREELARELLKSCPAAWHIDYNKIAQALKEGCSEAEILKMAEVIRLPGTYAWLAERLSWQVWGNPELPP